MGTPKVDYGEYGICEECGNKNTDNNWCLQCNSQRFQQNFGNWTSGNKDLDEIIQELQSNCTTTHSFVEWIPYSKFEDIKYIDKGGFGKIYSANWKEGLIYRWNIHRKKMERIGNYRVALKSLNDSQNITTEFLNEFKNNLKCQQGASSTIILCCGITQDPETKNYMFVMPFMEGGNLRNFLKSKFSKLTWKDKLNNLLWISSGLHHMHDESNLIHRDFHIGNILLHSHEYCLITDLGLSKPIDETGISKDGKQKVFGVIPYIAPEVLSGDDNYSKASDIYGFAMIMFELLTGIPPFYNIPHDKDLALKICNGCRPEIPSNIVIPQLLVDIMKRCWDAKSDQRPTAKKLWNDFCNYKSNIEYEVKESELWKQIEECNRLNSTNPVDNNNTNSSTSYEIHPSAIYTSRGFNFKNLPKPKNLNENDDENINELITEDCLNEELNEIDNENSKEQSNEELNEIDNENSKEQSSLPALVEDFPVAQLSIYITKDGVVYKNDVYKTIKNNKQNKEHQLKLMNKHLHQHPLIPTIEGQFLSSNLIWTTAVQEIYNFCRQNSLPWLWYSSERWSLWFRAGCNKISILKTNMFVEAPLESFKENLVTFIIVEQVIPHQQRRFEQIFIVKREKSNWRKSFKKEWKELSTRIVDVQFFDQIYRHNQYPFLNSSFTCVNNFKQSTFQISSTENILDEDSKVYEDMYRKLIDILKDQQSKKNFKWIKGIEKNFKPIEEMLNEISVYKRRKTMPRTLKDHSQYIIF
ncbi:hypothetical protein Glove_629g16 [Diversispora epigaea]|uniref:Protein kinase domain-containing protein n=1 Tax=Diversispora epigaea TaxID=1348612 RepID=A0A397G5A7_9GLOM|nr:hypothetical protein Glove_629g16 [Diversispora epigaea]